MKPNLLYKLILHKKARESLDYTRIYEKQDFGYLIQALEELEQKGLESSSLKDIGDNIFRKRVGRWRIVFDKQGIDIHARIIAIEKDTKKDYKLWRQYVIGMR